jgi:hypothetical protein
MAARQEEELRLKRMAEQRQREKEEEARAREKIRAKLEEDRRERRRRLGLPEELTEEEKEEERRKLQVGPSVCHIRAAKQLAVVGRATEGNRARCWSPVCASQCLPFLLRLCRPNWRRRSAASCRSSR